MENNIKNQEYSISKMSKIKAKSDSSIAFDSLLNDCYNSLQNGLEWDADFEKVGIVRRYYNRYYFFNYLIALFCLSIIGFVASFFYKLSFFIILMSPIILIFFSKSIYLFLLFYNHPKIEKEVKKSISSKIFPNNDFYFFIFLNITLFGISYTASLHTTSLFIPELLENTKIYNSLIANFSLFDVNNELLAYSVFLSLIIIIIYKIIRK